MGITILERSDSAVITVDELKANKRIYNSLEDSLFAEMIFDAQEFIETETNRSLMRQKIRLDLDRIYPEIHLPRPPSVSVEKITLIEDDEETIVDISGGVSVDFVDRMLSLVSIPTVDSARSGRMSIEYFAGVDAATDAHRTLRRAVMLLSSHWATSREAAFMDKRLMDVAKEIPFGVQDIIKAFRVPNIQSQFDGR